MHGHAAVGKKPPRTAKQREAREAKVVRIKKKKEKEVEEARIETPSRPPPTVSSGILIGQSKSSWLPNQFAAFQVPSRSSATDEVKPAMTPSSSVTDVGKAPGLLASAGQINARPPSTYTDHNPHSTRYEPVYAGPASLQAQEDLSMLALATDGREQPSYMEENLNMMRDDRWYVAVIIDADNLLFRPSIARKGSLGGQQAEMWIRKCISEDLKLQRTLEVGRLHLQCFCSLARLKGFLEGSHQVNAHVYDQFTEGLAHSGPFHIFSTSGRQQQAADVKVKAHLAWHVNNKDCIRVYLGGVGDMGYMADLDSLRKRSKLDKIQLLAVPEYVKRSAFYEEYKGIEVNWGSEIFTMSEDLARQGLLAPKPIRVPTKENSDRIDGYTT